MSSYHIFQETRDGQTRLMGHTRKLKSAVLQTLRFQSGYVTSGPDADGPCDEVFRASGKGSICSGIPQAMRILEYEDELDELITVDGLIAQEAQNMPRHREQNILEAVSCPQCNAWTGTACFVEGQPAEIQPGRPFVHPERKEAWMEWKRKQGIVQPEPVPAPCPVCGTQCPSKTKAKLHCAAK